jgi:hypothetical protein
LCSKSSSITDMSERETLVTAAAEREPAAAEREPAAAEREPAAAEREPAATAAAAGVVADGTTPAAEYKSIQPILPRSTRYGLLCFAQQFGEELPAGLTAALASDGDIGYSTVLDLFSHVDKFSRMAELVCETAKEPPLEGRIPQELRAHTALVPNPYRAMLRFQQDAYKSEYDQGSWPLTAAQLTEFETRRELEGAGAFDQIMVSRDHCRRPRRPLPPTPPTIAADPADHCRRPLPPTIACRCCRPRGMRGRRASWTRSHTLSTSLHRPRSHPCTPAS